LRAASGPLCYSGAKHGAGQTATFLVAGHGGLPATGVSAVTRNPALGAPADSTVNGNLGARRVQSQ
jgi:hypothetical protein